VGAFGSKDCAFAPAVVTTNKTKPSQNRFEFLSTCNLRNIINLKDCKAMCR